MAAASIPQSTQTAPAGSCRESDKRSVGAPQPAQPVRCGRYPASHRSLSWKESASGSNTGPSAVVQQKLLDSVQNVEEAHERVERTGILVMLDEQPQNGLEPDVAHRRSVGIARQGPDATGGGRRPVTVPLAPALVELNVDVAERLEACPKRERVRRTPFAMAPSRP